MNPTIPARLSALRAAMHHHAVNAVLIPSADPHLSEYLPAHWQARVWFSGFDGSAGTLVVTQTEAALWTDSRYFAQAEQQLAGSGITLMKLRVPHAAEHLAWLQQHLHAGNVLAVAGDSLSLATQQRLQQDLDACGAALRIDLDLPGSVWTERPPLPRAPVIAHAPAYVDASRADKLARVCRALRSHGATRHLLSSLDDIAWLLNLRGSDVECNPVFLAHLLLGDDQRATLFVDYGKLDDALVAALAVDGVEVAQYAAITTALSALPAETTLLLDGAHVASAIAAAIPAQVRRIDAANPSTLFKAVKSAAELDHIRAVMRCDGAALVRAFRRLEQRLAAGVVTTEVDVDTLLHEERSAQPGWVGESFATIAGYRANAALPHYRATAEQHRTLQASDLLLVDSGGQYLGGTTDITRVLALGATTPEQRRDCTLVLKGMIALSRARFPQGASGPQLDALARAPLWACGMDYGHGTGHGVGYFLNVHEGPHGIRPPSPDGALVPLQAGMITSIEPGVYKPGRHGIRHENLAVVVAAENTEFGEFLAFETLTLCPFDRRTLEPGLLSPDDRAWLDDYHASVRAALGPLLEGVDLAWLERHCAPL
ncbi:MAG TPA: aminopeptidase P family protein [Rhodanobacter sp.]|nr:aminopeptidase P family protein [Rhodanobacter sp.]